MREPNTRGKTLYEKYKQDERLTRRESIIAKCYECSNGYIDGRKDCGITSCPLYPYAPYKRHDK